MKRIPLIASLILISILTLKAQNNNSSEKWKPIFDKYKVNGTFVLYNTSSGEYQTYNKARSDSAFLPASTFKIINSLVALQTSTVSSINDTIKWDGIDRGWPKWNQDQTMKTALPYSCVWFYQELARRIGEKSMQKWIDSVGYGNTKMGTRIDNFWLIGDLRISAMEQVKFLERLVNGELPFDKKVQETVKKIMITDSTDNYVLHSKTGWVGGKANPQIGWFVGYVETSKGVWIFALNIDIHANSDAEYRKLISYEILKKEGIIN